MATLRQRTSFGPGTYRGHIFDKARFQRFVDGSNKAIAAGVPIPLLQVHAPINASDTATKQFADEKGAGWIKKYDLDEDGNLGWEADGVPDDIAKAVNEGTIRFTSPEFRETYASEKEGVYTGPIIRHMAFTPKPGNPIQGAIETIALQEAVGAYQFTEEERKPISQHDELPAKTTSAPDIDTPESPPVADAANPDAPPKATDKSKLAAVIAGLNQLGIVLPSTFDFMDDSALDILVGCLNTKIKADNESEAEKAAEEMDDDGQPVTDAPMPFSERTSVLSQHGYERDNLNSHPNKGYSVYKRKGVGRDGKHTYHSVLLLKKKKWAGAGGEGTGHESLANHLAKIHSSQHSEGDYVMQFTEDELKALPPSVKAKLEAESKARKEAEAKALQFEEEKKVQLNTAAKEKAVGVVTNAKIAPGLVQELLKGYDTVQFNEGAEQPTYTAEQVAKMVEQYAPLQFSVEDATDSALPKGVDSKQFFEEGDVPTGHVSPERARELVNGNQYINSNHRAKPQPTPTIAEQIALENARHPNKVMNN